jgi:hypothetical protein
VNINELHIHTPEQNGHPNTTLVEITCCMIHQKRLYINILSKAIAIATYLKSRDPCRALRELIPQKAWTTFIGCGTLSRNILISKGIVFLRQQATDNWHVHSIASHKQRIDHFGNNC